LTANVKELSDVLFRAKEFPKPLARILKAFGISQYKIFVMMTLVLPHQSRHLTIKPLSN